MKKISTLVLTACFAVSALAQSFAPAVVPTSHDGEKVFSLEQKAQLKADKASAKAALPAALQKELAKTPHRPLDKQAHKVAPAAVQKAPAAVKEELNVSVIGLGALYYEEDSDWYIAFQSRDGRYAFYFDVISEDLNSPAGSYTEEDAIPTYCVLVDNETLVESVWGSYPAEYAISSFSLTVEVKNDTLYGTGTAVAADGNTYHLTTDYTIPAVTNHVTYTATDLDIDDSDLSYYGYYTAVANDSEKGLGVWFQLYPEDLSAGTPYGTYESADLLFGTVDLQEYTEKQIVIASGSVTLAQAENGMALTGSLIDYSGNEYTFNLTYEMPEITDNVAVVATNLQIDDSLLDWFGVITLTASNETHAITLMLAPEGESIYGSYSTIYYCDVIDFVNKDTTVLDVAAGEGVLEQSLDGSPSFIGAVLNQDGTLYEIYLSQVFPAEAVREANLTIVGEEIQITNGGFLAQGYTDVVDPNLLDSIHDQAYLSVGLAFEGESIVGKYDTEDVLADYTTLAFLNSADIYDNTVVLVKVSNIEVTDQPEAETYTLTADVLTIDGVLYHATIVSPFPSGHLDYDVEEGAITRVITEEDNIQVVDNVATDGYVLFRVAGVDEEGAADLLSVLFYTDEVDPDVVLPAGEYPITDTYEPGTVQASPGVQSGSVYASFYGHTNEDGLLTSPIYFFRSGKAVVEKNDGKLSLTIDALNSYDVPLKVTYSQLETALENTTSESVATKRITRDGQLQIIRGEHIYNATGAILK